MIEVWFLSMLRMQSRLFPCPLASGFRINIHIHRLYTGILTTNQRFDMVRYYVLLCFSRVFHPLLSNSLLLRRTFFRNRMEPVNSSWLILTFNFFPSRYWCPRCRTDENRKFGCIYQYQDKEVSMSELQECLRPKTESDQTFAIRMQTRATISVSLLSATK